MVGIRDSGYAARGLSEGDVIDINCQVVVMKRLNVSQSK